MCLSVVYMIVSERYGCERLCGECEAKGSLLTLTHIRARGTPMLRARRHGYAPLGDAEPARTRLFRRRSSPRPAADGVFRNVVAHGVADITRREIAHEQPPVCALRISAA
jgi:hypothetical protein